jgi:heat shock protein HslJ
MRFLLLLLPLLSFACTPKPTTANSPAKNATAMASLPIPSAWDLISCERDGKTIPAGNDKAFIAIREGEIGGHTGCNVFGGEWTGSAAQMVVPGVMSTKMYCDKVADQERQILDMLNGKVSCKTTDGETLVISSGKEKLILRRNDKWLK